MNDIIIRPHAGGLGDVLLYSTLPSLFQRFPHSDSGRVYWSSRPFGDGKCFRNPEVEELIFKDPNLHGWSDAEPNAGGAVFEGTDIIREAKNARTPVEAVERIHLVGAGVPYSQFGVSQTSSLPKIYYYPNYLPEWRNKIVGSFCSISQAFSQQAIEEFYGWVRRWHLVETVDEEITMLESKYDGSSKRRLIGTPHYTVRDLFEKIDIIYSCKAFLTVESGDNMLASAIRKHADRKHTDTPRMFCLMTTRSYNDRLFVMPNVTYYITGTMTPDYHSYP